jgi:glutamate-1-semialdehyde 2,1-aminomutase
MASNPLADLLRDPWVADTYRELAARRDRSNQLVTALRAVDATSPIFWPFHAPPAPPCVAEAYGSRFLDVDGNEYLDCHLGWGAQALHGHNPEPVVRAVREALGRSTGNGYFNAIELEHARFLRELLPHCEKFGFFHSGTDATFAAIRLARAATGRRLVAKVEGGLHGIHDLAMQNTAFWYHGYPQVPYPPSESTGVQPTSALRGVASAEADDLLVLPHNSDDAFALVEQHRHELACIIAEPVSSSFPFEEQSVPFVRRLALTAQSLGIPFVLDEVLTGFRSGISGMAARYDIPADMITYGKVISALGLPLSALGGSARFLDLAQTTGMSMTDWGRRTCVNTTHMSNHLALCASHATLQLLRDKGEQYYRDTRARVGWLRGQLDAFRREHGVPIMLTGFGDFMGAFTISDRIDPRNTREFAASVNTTAMYILTLMLRKRGVFTFSMPMLFTGGAHSQSDIEFLYQQVADSLLEMKRHNVPFSLETTR